MVVSGTGHRPNKLGGYNQDVVTKLHKTAIRSLLILNPTEVISGMALGWDTALATAALELSIPLRAAIPFKGQERIWNEESRRVYFNTLDRASEVIEVCEPGYAPWKMMKRNEYMNDNADTILALFDIISVSGGTFHCIKDALSKEKDVFNAWDIFQGTGQQLVKILNLGKS